MTCKKDYFGRLNKPTMLQIQYLEELKTRKINQDIECCKGMLTSNIGKIVESIIEDEGESVI